jgi:hypothetical protein
MGRLSTVSQTDTETLHAYDHEAAEFAEDWHAQPSPSDMHALPPDALVPSLQRLLTLLRPAGTLYLSWRVTGGTSRRDEHGRLYAAFDTGIVVSALSGASLLRDEELVSVSSGKKVHRIIARKN